MKTLVVDASALVPMAIAGVRPSPFVDLELTGPPLLWSETTSALGELVWRGLLDPGSGSKAVSAVDGLAVVRQCPDELYREAFQLAATLGWAKTYDAEYVALARLLDAPLLTRDARLTRGASRLVTFYQPTGDS